MPAVFIPVAIAAASALYQGIKGAKQKREADALQRQADEQQKANLADARRMALTGMPEAQRKAAEQNILRQQAVGLGALRDRRSALAGLPAVQRTTNDALINLSAQDAAMRRQAENVALGQANQYAGYQANNAAQRRQSGEALTGAAMSNLYNAGVGAAYALDKDGNSDGIYSSLLGANGKTGATNINLNTSLFGSRGYQGMPLYSNPY